MPSLPHADGHFRSLRLETLEPRQMLSSTPWGAGSLDTAEYLLGDVGVTLVLMESQGSVSTEDWTTESIEAVKTKVAEGLQWWKDTLAAQSSVHSLNFVFDTSYADNPVPTSVEPIARTSNTYVTWVNEFLTYVDGNSSETIGTDIRHFNDSQRQALSTHWAFTIFVVNDENDADGQFASGGSFSRAFAFPGGQFYVAPAGRPAATFAHELGHIFWARDEYSGAGSYTDQRGYYDAQNWNAANNPTAGFQQVDSIMASGTLMANAYAQHVSSPSSLEMIGWRDTDEDGVFDVLDVPHQLQGTGAFDPSTGKYTFVGSASVQTLPNLNSSGQFNDIVLNQLDVVEYRLDGGAWQTLETPGSYQAELNLSLPAGPAVQVVEVRTRSVDAGTGQTVTTSDIFWGRTDVITTTAEAGIRGVVWNDADGDSAWDAGEDALAGWQVRLVDGAGQAVELASYVEPDDFTDSDSLNTQDPAVTLAPIGSDVGNVPVVSRQSQYTSTGSRVFGNHSWSQGSVTTGWADSKRELRISFPEPVTYVSIDAVADTNGDYGRLEIYDASDQLLARYTTTALDQGQVETMALGRATAEISYAIASGHADTDVQLDRLQVGPHSIATTDSQGAYWLSWLPPGEYRLQTVDQGNWADTAPSNGIHTVVLTTGEARGQIDFGQQTAPGSPWQNAATPHDVNTDLVLTPLDALIVINDLNLAGARLLPNPPAEGEGPPPFPDVNGDGYLTPSDALAVINALNASCCSGEGAGEGESAGPEQRDQDEPSPEGEANLLWDQLSHDLWDQPLQVSSQPVAIAAADPLIIGPELAVYQQVVRADGPVVSRELADQNSASDLMLETGALGSPLEAVFYELGLDPGCTL